MLNLHGRCRDMEALLMGRISDLEARLAEELKARQTLVDRIIAMTNPLAYSAIAAAGRSEAPAQRMPAGIARAAQPMRRATGPILTPRGSGFRPGGAGTAAAEKAAAESAQPDPLADIVYEPLAAADVKEG